MSDYVRYAIYYLPPEGPLAAFGAEWLGWDVARGRPVPQPEVPGIAEMTAAPRKYGFHGTLKPPFRLAERTDAEGLMAAVERLAASRAPVRLDALEVGAMGHFLALVPRGEAGGLRDLAGACVAELDGFRAPPGAAELARRRKAGLSARQEEMLARWGYPYVLEEFRFHMTLTGRLSPAELTRAKAEVRRRLPELAEPYVIDAIALAAERSDGMFETVHRYALSG